MYSKRVHIVPVGADIERMVEPAIQMRADVVYLLADAPSTTDTSSSQLPAVEWTDEASVERYVSQLRRGGFDHAAAASERLAANHIEAPVEFVDQHDVYAVLGLVTTLAHRYREHTVTVNVSTGTRLATIGAAMARMDEATDAEAYHVPAGDTAAASDSPEGVDEVPDYHLESPSRDALTTMAVVAARDTPTHMVKKSDLIDWALQLNAAGVSTGYADRIVQSHRNNGHPEAPTGFDDLDQSIKKGAYRTLRTSVLDDLLARGYLDVDDQQVGRSDLLSLTADGENALQAFRHKIIDVIEVLDDHRKVDALPAFLARGLSDGA